MLLARMRSPDDVMPRRETLELVRACYRIRDSEVRDALDAMTKAMTKGAGTPYARETVSAVNGGAKRDHLGGVRRDRLAAAGLSP